MGGAEGLSGAKITTIDRFTLGEALSLLVFPFVLVYVFCFFMEGTNERFTNALYAFDLPVTWG